MSNLRPFVDYAILQPHLNRSVEIGPAFLKDLALQAGANLHFGSCAEPFRCNKQKFAPTAQRENQTGPGCCPRYWCATCPLRCWRPRWIVIGVLTQKVTGDRAEKADDWSQLLVAVSDDQ